MMKVGIATVIMTTMMTIGAGVATVTTVAITMAGANTATTTDHGVTGPSKGLAAGAAASQTNTSSAKAVA